MKKIISGLICFNFLAIQGVFASILFEDDLVKKLDKNLKIEYKKQALIEDNLVKKTLNPNLKIKPYKVILIEDNLVKNLDKTLRIEKYNQRMLDDSLALKLSGKNVINTKFSGDKIKVSPMNLYTTKHGLYEGGLIDFVLVEDVKFGKMTYKKGTIIKARVETLSQNSAYGVPADLVVGNFTLPNNLVLNGSITKQGANRAIWVYPTGYILTCFFFIGLPIFAIRGGHAKLQPHKVYEIEI